MSAAEQTKTTFMSLRGFCNRLSISLPTGRRLVNTGRLKVLKLNGRIRISENEFQRFIHSLEVKEEMYIPENAFDHAVSYLIKASATTEKWETVWTLKSKGLIREFARTTYRGPCKELELLVEMAQSTAKLIDRTVFDIAPAFQYRYRIGERVYFVAFPGAPLIDIKEASLELKKKMNTYSLWDFSTGKLLEDIPIFRDDALA